MRRITIRVAWLTALVLLVGCSGAPRQAQTLAPDFGDLVGRISLGPVVFRDEPIDRYYAQRLAMEILEQTQETLAAKGYEVTPFGGESVLFPFGDAPVGPFSPRSGDDALLLVEIDHFLDAVLYDRASPQGLDIYATATLTSAGGDLLWKDSGVGRGPRQTTVPGQLDWFIAPASLVQSLFATFPPR